MASSSSVALRRGRGDDELELRLYLGLNGDARGSVRWSEVWWSCVRKLSKNGAAVVVHELSGDAAVMERRSASLGGQEREVERGRESVSE